MLTVWVNAVVQLSKMNVVNVTVTVSQILIVTVMVIQMLDVVAAKLDLLAVIMPVVQLLQMMNAAYAVVITHLVQIVLARQMVMLQQMVVAPVIMTHPMTALRIAWAPLVEMQIMIVPVTVVVKMIHLA